MTKTGTWLAKSLFAGMGLGVAAFAVSYGFLTVHQELGIRPKVVSYGAALLAFGCGTILALIYFRMKEKD